MTSIIPTLLHDGATTRRVARALLRHIGPSDREEAISMLYQRIGVYTCDNKAITTEVDHYFQP